MLCGKTDKRPFVIMERKFRRRQNRYIRSGLTTGFHEILLSRLIAFMWDEGKADSILRQAKSQQNSPAHLNLPPYGADDCGHVLRFAGHDNASGTIGQRDQQHIQSNIADLLHREIDPAATIYFIYPRQRASAGCVNIRDHQEDRPAGITAAPTLVISDVDTAGGCTLSWIDEINGGRGINFAVEQIGYVGLDMLLVSLAYGAGSVVVACEPQNVPAIISAVRWQVQMGRAILLGLGLPEDRIRFAFIPHESDQPGKENFVKTCCETRPDIPILSPAEFSFHNDKRTLVRLAAQHLFDQSGVREPALPLPAGSPFGAVEIDAAACTLCMACAA